MARRPGFQKNFRIKKKVKPPVTHLSPKLTTNEGRETLTGMVRGMKASDLEERYCLALDEAQKRGTIDYYYFRYAIGNRGAPGWKELDVMVVSRGAYYPVQVDDTTFIHRGSSAHDTMTETIIMDGLKKMGINAFPIVRVTDKDLGNPKDAKRKVQEMFG